MNKTIKRKYFTLICILAISFIMILAIFLLYAYSNTDNKIIAHTNISGTDYLNPTPSPTSSSVTMTQSPSPSPIKSISESTTPKTLKPSYAPSNNSKGKYLYYSGKSTGRLAAITFDDGPDQTITSKILDILSLYNVKATFFVIGQKASAYPNIVKKIASGGHVVANHTYTHSNLNNLSESNIRLEVQKTEDVIDSIIGSHVNIMRPPYGNNSSKVVQTVSSMNYKLVDWSVDTRDWTGASTSTMMKYVSNQIYPGGIILHHCSSGRNNTIQVLGQEIEYLKANGYTLVTVPQIIN